MIDTQFFYIIKQIIVVLHDKFIYFISNAHFEQFGDERCLLEREGD